MTKMFFVEALDSNGDDLSWFIEANSAEEALTPPPAVECWAYIIGQRIVAVSDQRTAWQLPWMPELHGHRIARIRVTEIQAPADV